MPITPRDIKARDVQGSLSSSTEMQPTLRWKMAIQQSQQDYTVGKFETKILITLVHEWLSFQIWLLDKNHRHSGCSLMFPGKWKCYIVAAVIV